MRRIAATLLVTLIGAVGACQGFATHDIGSGLGASCNRDDECQGSKCVDGVCTIPCESTKCPGKMVCVASLCQLPLAVGFIYPGEVLQEPFTQSVELGRSTLVTDRPYVFSTYVEDKFLDGDVVDAASTLYAQGYKIIVGGLPSYGPTLQAFANSHSDAQLMVLGSRVANGNLTSFDVRTYQGYYLAGIAAGRVSQKKRLGIIGSVYSPPVVASINAFTLGARSTDPAIVVEVRWIGDYHDRGAPQAMGTLERIDALALMADGADVIAHTLDNNIAVTTVVQAAIPGTYAIGANVREACDGPPPFPCIGSVYYNWAPVLTELIDDYHKQNLPQRVLDSIQLSSVDSPIAFTVSQQNCGPCTQALSAELDMMRGNLASDGGVSRVFKGPIQSTGQCEAKNNVPICVADGATLDNQGLDSMCWFVQGVVEKDGANMDQPAMVPAMGDCAPMKP